MTFSIFKNINRFAGKWSWLDSVSVFCAKYLLYLMLFVLFVFGIFQNNLKLFFYCLASALFALLVIAKAVYVFYKKQRPATLRGTKVLIPIPKNPSFPSSHASFVFGLSFLLLFYNFDLAIIFLICSIIVGLARIFCGVHWARDILGGVIVGFLSALLVNFFILNWTRMDLYLFDSINQFAGKWPLLDYLGMFFAQYFEYFLWLCVLLFLAINFKKYWKMALEGVIAAVLTRFVVAEAIRWMWFRPRPFVALNFIPLINQSAKEASFPSGHASFYFALSTIVYYHNKKAGILFYIASCLIAIARVFVGVHWPLDILSGAVLGILMGWALNKIFRKHAHKYIRGYNN